MASPNKTPQMQQTVPVTTPGTTDPTQPQAPQTPPGVNGPPTPANANANIVNNTERQRRETVKKNLEGHKSSWINSAPKIMEKYVVPPALGATGIGVGFIAANSNIPTLIVKGVEISTPLLIKLFPLFTFFGMGSMLAWIQTKWFGGKAASSAPAKPSGGGGGHH